MPTRNVSIENPKDDPLVQQLYAKELKYHEEIKHLLAAQSDISNAISRQTAGVVNPVDDAAISMLKGGFQSFNGSLDIAGQATIVANKLKVTRRAFDMNRKELDTARDAARVRIVEARKPAYAAIMAKMKGQVESLLATLQEEAGFRRQADADDLQLSLAMTTVNFDPWPLQSWLTRAAEHWGV